MCGASKPSPQPNLAQAAPSSTAEATTQPDNRKPGLTTQSGVFGNVFTSVLGDQNYGQNARAQSSATAKPLGL